MAITTPAQNPRGLARISFTGTCRPEAGDPPRGARRRPGPPRASARKGTALPARGVTGGRRVRPPNCRGSDDATRPARGGRTGGASADRTRARGSVLLGDLDAVLVRLDVHLVALLGDDAGHLHVRELAGAFVVLLGLALVVEVVGDLLVVLLDEQGVAAGVGLLERALAAGERALEGDRLVVLLLFVLGPDEQRGGEHHGQPE